MKSVIFSIVCLFLFTLTIVVAEMKTCFTSKCVNSESCEEKEVQCPDGSSCMIACEEFISGGKAFYSFSKRCEPNANCNTSNLANVGEDVLVRSYQHCCEGNRCNSGTCQLPALDTRAKGILCPFCHAFNTTDGCNAIVSVPCLGEADQCIRFRGSMILPDGRDVNFSAQGCCSKTICEKGYKQMIGLKVTKIEESTCYIPPPAQEVIPKI